MNRGKTIGIGLVFAVALFGMGGVVPARAQSIEELKAQIELLQKQLFVLQLAALSGEGSQCAFTATLSVGSKGKEVQCLQKYLIAKGYLGQSSVAKGYPQQHLATGYFGFLTKAAVAKSDS